MAIMIKEYLGNKGLEVKWNFDAKESFDVKESALNTQYVPGSIMVEHEALHVGPTRNYTWYTEEALKSSISTWTYPYARPVIKHHNEENGETIGRVHEASYHEKSLLSNTGYLKIVANIPDEKGIKEVKNGLLKTVSIGAVVHEVKCSICGHDIANFGECEHQRGEEYDGKICYWMITKMEAKELSYVIVPSDRYAQVTSFYDVAKAKVSVKESLDNTKGVKNMDNIEKEPVGSVKTTQEGVIIDEEGQIPGKQEPSVPEPSTKEPEPTPEEPAAEPETVETVSKEEYDNKVKELEAKIVSLETEVATLSKTVKDKSADLEKEIQAKEALENRLMTIQEAEKETVIGKVISVREQLGLSSDAERLKTKSLNFLKESLTDLQEELSFRSKTPTAKESVPVVPETVTSPSIAESEEQKPSTTNSPQINIAEKFNDDIMSMLSRAMDPKKY